ncbi:nucleocapsid [Precarious point virus]|uniref:Nucleoprotein n=2 Tax=Precarious point virus TaxID=487097 RepID=I1T362_9VIRU|nr:nucleocapsid [Precarious point virus]AEL29679.1 nucleocapsid [Precarious point virus]
MATDWVKFAQEIEAGGWEPEEIQELVSLFQYQGFDAAVILRRIAECAGKAGIDREEMLKDIRSMIVLHLTRGNKLSSIEKRLSEEGKKAFAKLRTRYHLTDKAREASDLTLSRIAIANAGLTCRILPQVVNFTAVTHSRMTQLSPGYPAVMMHNAFAGLISPELTDETIRALIDAHKLYLVEFSRTINVKHRGLSAREVMSANDSALQAGLASSFLSADQKKAYLKSFGLINAKGEATKVVEAAAEAFRALP